jgi:hypothetical protein
MAATCSVPVCAPTDLDKRKPPVGDWIERCRRADRQREHDRAVIRGLPIVPGKVKK